MADETATPTEGSVFLLHPFIKLKHYTKLCVLICSESGTIGQPIHISLREPDIKKLLKNDKMLADALERGH
jgi:hypothetical protein